MSENINVGDRVKVQLNSKQGQGWFAGVVVRIEPYSQHRSFYWVELDNDAQAMLGGGIKLISVLNSKNIQLA